MNDRYLWIRGGRVLDPATNTDAIADVFAADGRFVASLSAEQRAEARVVEAAGLMVAPGLVDIHVHLREPGQTHKENIATGTAAAAAGGFTTVVCMPNTTPVADSVGTIQAILDAIERDACVKVLPTGCITVGQKGEALAPIGSLHRAGVVAITDDGRCVQDNELMRRAVEYAHMFGLCVMDHCQDESLTRDAVMNEGHWSLRLGLRGWPNAAEDIIVARNVVLAHYTGAHIHLQHISSAYSVDLIRRAKGRGIRITAEVSPHHLHLTDEAVRTYDTRCKMNPPLRTELDRQALIQGVLDGTLDCIATDHAPHTDDEKDAEFDRAPFGVIGLETALAVSLEVLFHSGRTSLLNVVNLMSRKPAKLLALEGGTLEPGKDADIVLFNPYESWTVEGDRFQSRSANSPWLGQTLRGKVHGTWVRGNQVWDGNRVTPRPGTA